MDDVETGGLRFWVGSVAWVIFAIVAGLTLSAWDMLGRLTGRKRRD